MKFKRVLFNALLVTLVLAILCPFSVLAQTWEFLFPTTIVDTSGTTRTYEPVLTGMTAQSLVDSGYLDYTSMMGTDTNMDVGGTSIPYMLSTTQVATVLPTFGAGSEVTANLRTGYAPVQADFPIVVGTGGYFETPDSANIELGNEFEVVVDGYVDTSATTYAKHLVYKQDAFRVTVNDTTDGTVEAAISGATAMPVIAATNISSDAVDQQNHTVLLPAGIVSGHLLIALFATDGNPTITFPAGWTQLMDEDTTTSLARVAVYYRIADGTEGANITVTTDANEMTAHATYRITGYRGVPEIGVAAKGNDANPDPPSLTPSWSTYGNQDTLWVAVCGYDDGNTAVAGFPANYVLQQIWTRSLNAAGAGVGMAGRQLQAASDDPGVFLLNFAEEWVANTIAIRPAYNDAAIVTATSVSSGDMLVEARQTADLSFDGVGDYVDCGNNVSLQIVADITVACWIKAGNVAVYTPLSKSDANADRSWIINNSANKFRVYLSDDGTLGAGHYKEYETSVAAFDSTWHHIAFTFDASASTLALYVDGVVDGAVVKTNDDAITSLHNCTQNFLMGAEWNTAPAQQNLFVGELDDVRVWDRLLSAGEITTVFNDSISMTDANLQAWWEINEGAGGTTADSSANTNTGTITNATWDYGFFDLKIDGVRQDYADEAAMVNNANDWFFMTQNSMPYMDYVQFTIDDDMQLWYQPTDILIGTTLKEHNLLTNGYFTEGDPPDDWISVNCILSQDTVQSYLWDYSALVTANGTRGRIREAIDLTWEGTPLTLGVRVLCPVTNTTDTRLYIWDSVASTASGIVVKDGAWHWTTVTHTISAAPAWAWAELSVSSIGQTDYDDYAYFDESFLVVGAAFEDATITWGTNTNMTITYNETESFEATVSDIATNEIGYNVVDADMPSTWFGGGTMTTLPLYDNFLAVSTDIGMPVRTIYLIFIFALAMAMGFGTFLLFRQTLISFGVAGVILWAGVNMNVIPAWVVFSYGVVGIAIIYSRRQL